MADNPSIEESDIDMSWDMNKELSVVISCIKNVLWIKDQQDFGNKCLIRELLQKCSGGQIIEMLKHILSGDVQRHQRRGWRRGGRAAGPDAEDDGGAGAEAHCPARAGRSVTTFTLKPLSCIHRKI